jgi:arginyl-tRNA synthetase
MALAKKIKTNPRTLAQEVVKRLEIDDICEPPEIAGPGFINLRLKPDFVAEGLLEINRDAVRLGVDKVTLPKTVVVDFSGPNIAKQMHVGHLRSTIIGDCICRMLEFEGYKVIRQNHIGDWGTQFGMLCALYDKKLLFEGADSPDDILGDLEAFYREAQERFKSGDEQFVKTARAAILGLHTGHSIFTDYWENIVKYSERHFKDIYKRLGVTLTDKDIRGESFYKDKLADVVEELKKKGLAVESEGAICVFPPGFKDKEGKSLPLIIQKTDGAFLYATTDLAAIRYRTEQLKSDRIIYVTDSRQSLHFEMVFAVARMAGWDVKQNTEDRIQKIEGRGEKTEFVHVTFGSVLGEDGKPLKTRSGENVKLKELLDEAVMRARAVVEEKNPELSTGEKEKIAKAVGIGAVKYADYSNNRTSDYIFSFNRMLAMEGNTAPYMQYAYARIKSIERKAQSRDVDVSTELAGVKEMNLTEPAELDLARHLIGYGVAIEIAVSDYRPNYLTNYLYELAQKFSVFYANCPVLAAEPAKRPTRLLLCDLTARTIRHGLSELLGIDVVEQM